MEPIEDSPISFDTFAFNLETSSSPYSLTPFLFQGGAAMNRRKAESLGNGEKIVESRIPLVGSIYEELLTKRTAGFPDKTICNYYYALKAFFRWADKNDQSPSRSTLVENYLQYTEHLLHRTRIRRDLEEASAYAMASTVSAVLDGVLDLKNGLLFQSRIRKPSSPPPWKRSQEFALDSEAQEMGSALMSISDALSLESICEQLPVRIKLEDNKQISLGSHSFREAVPTQEDGSPDIKSIIERRRALINFRTEVELLIFISQTGMNMEQVRTQRLSAFRFVKDKSDSNCVNVVKNYKRRRGGEVEFEIFPEYKEIFLRFLVFRHQIFPNDPDGFLFRFLDQPWTKKQRYYDPQAVKNKFKISGVPYRSPRKLRSIRLNSLLERIGDIIAVSEMGQHSPEVLTRHYARPSVKTALREVALFHQLNDPTIDPPGPGQCVEQAPNKIAGATDSAPNPDCRSPAGCLFCDKQRDIDSLDHVWSLLSFRRLKSIELSKYRGTDAGGQPPYAVIQRISEKVQFFAASNGGRSDWVTEAEERVTEDWFHPAWRHFIKFAETII